jgi:D-glycero-alpha-D-manno-heptose-7-phosphate kinase
VKLVARAPLRIDFGGGWTDVPPFARAEGGAVLNAAITRYVAGSLNRPTTTGWLRPLRGNRSFLRYQVDTPAGAGLGASAAQTVVWAALVRTSIANTAERRDIAEMACGIAAALGLQGGKQDEYASALGGINLMRFGENVDVEPLQLAGKAADLAERLLLAYSGQRRVSGAIHADVWEQYRQGRPVVVGALQSLKRLALEMRAALLAADLDTFGDLLNENWHFQRELHPSITNQRLDDIIALARRSGARGAKACGAGGGGCVVLLAETGGVDRLRHTLRSRGVTLLDFGFDFHGVRIARG